jgi:hypothetical protein
MRLSSTILAFIVISTTAMPISAGRSSGKATIESVIKPNATESYTDKYDGDKPAQIILVGEHTTDIDCYVYYTNGSLVGSDIKPGDSCNVNWVPKVTEHFIIKIINLGDEENKYHLTIN